MDSEDQLVMTLAGQLAAYGPLCRALIKTHPDRDALYAAFLEEAKRADQIMSADGPMRPFFDAAYDSILSSLKPR